MASTLILLQLLQAMAVSLGVGSSTLAILSFFKALADGKISPEERSLLGVVYLVLRVAMGLILFTTSFLSAEPALSSGTFEYTPAMQAVWVLIAMLFLNALLMTKKIIPMNIGPALQAATWYALGTMTTLTLIGVVLPRIEYFFLGYILDVICTIMLVSVTMHYLKKKSMRQPSE